MYRLPPICTLLILIYCLNISCKLRPTSSAVKANEKAEKPKFVSMVEKISQVTSDPVGFFKVFRNRKWVSEYPGGYRGYALVPFSRSPNKSPMGLKPRILVSTHLETPAKFGFLAFSPEQELLMRIKG